MSDRDDRDRDLETLAAYHDGELRGLARLRLERRLRREPELRRELALLVRVGDAVRASAAPAPGPDLWDRIAMRLPAEDARRAEAGAARASRSRRAWLVGGPLGAAAATAVALAIGLGERQPPSVGVVRWMDAGKRNVMVIDDGSASDTTIIWVLDAPQPIGEGRGGSGGVA
jgi:anti-sigma-K factor RskA